MIDCIFSKKTYGVILIISNVKIYAFRWFSTQDIKIKMSSTNLKLKYGIKSSHFVHSALLNLTKILLCIDDIDCIMFIHKNWQSGVMGVCRSHSLKVGGSNPVGGGTSLDVKCCKRWWL